MIEWKLHQWQYENSDGDCMKTSTTENGSNKLKNCPLRIENPDYTENKIKID